MKNLISKFEHSDIFHLKPKKIMVLLGTIVPFFCCHVMAYSFSFKRDVSSGLKLNEEINKGSYYFFGLISIILLFVGYSMIILILWEFLSITGTFVQKILSILASLIGYFAMNLFCTLWAYTKFKILKKLNSLRHPRF